MRVYGMELVEALVQNILLDALLLFLALIYWKTNQVKFSNLFPKIPYFESIKRGLILAFFLLAFSMVIGLVATYLGFNDSAKVGETLKSLSAVSPWLILYLLIVRVAVEELFFRVFLTREIGPILATVLFALGHIGYGSSVELIGAFLLGLVLAYYYQKRQDIAANFIGHFVYNAVVFGIVMAVAA